MIVFHTDLDNTLIYSYKHDIGDQKRCVEICQGREISFVTQETYRLLQRLSEQKSQVLIVPTTTRTIEQYQRIDLGAGVFPYALVCNGGVLLVNGKEDKDWYRGSLERIRYCKSELDNALEFLETDTRRNFELRFIKELFVFTKCEESEAVVKDLRKVLNTNVVDVFHNGVKVYVVPKALDKGKAVERFRGYIGADYVIAAGDSEFDIPMLEAADRGIAAPELAQGCFFADKIQCPSIERVFAEAVLETVSKYCSERIFETGRNMISGQGIRSAKQS
ncbi:MAG: HAD hydrolase family protein [Lachnospiraceae bacterium]|nr:HAD hydrolase family protein [Lachnospiraceae bacterium]